MSVTSANKSHLQTILFGVFLLLAAIFIIFNTAGVGLSGVKPVRIAGVDVVSVPNSPIIINNNNKLIYTYGAPMTNLVLDDPLLGISERAIKLIRKVEMYQWTQTQESKKEKLEESVDKETVVYTYKPVWSSDLIDSNTFKDKVNYKNPLTMPVDGLKRKVQDVSVGDFKLSGALIDLITTETEVDLTKLDINQLQERSKNKVFHDGKYIFVGDDVNHPAIGNLRISLFKVAPSQLSVIAQQKDANLDVMTLADGKVIAFVAEGRVPAKDMIKSGGFSVWVFYILSLVMMFFAVFAILSAVSIHRVLAQIIRQFGHYIGSFLIASVLWLFIMSIAQFFINLPQSLIFFAIMVALVFFLVRVRKI